LQSAMLNLIQQWFTIKKDPSVFVNPNRYNIGSGSITFLQTSDSIIDWEHLSISGGYPNRVLLVDHYAIETKFKRQLEMLRRYDPDCGNFNICNPAEEVKFTKEQKVAFAKEQHKRMLDLVRKGLQ